MLQDRFRHFIGSARGNIIDSRRLFSVGGIEYMPDTSVANELMRLTRREPAGCDKNPFIRFFFTESIARNELNLISIDRF